MNRTLLFAALAALGLAACERSGTPAQPGAETVSQPSAETTESQREAVTDTVPPAPQDESDAATQSQESAGEETTDTGEPVGQSRSDASLERLAALPAAQQLPSGRWKAGVHYQPIVPAQPTNVAPGKVEVTEVFWYACSHCYALEPYIASWQKNKPEYVEFVRVPVMWGPVHRAHARLFYTLEALGRSDLHPKVFETIHQRRNMLVANDEERTLQLQLEFAKSNGIEPEEFRKAYQSFSVNSNLQRAEQLTKRYQVEGVPLIVVNGKYTTDVGMAGGQSNLLELVNDLAAAEQRR